MSDEASVLKKKFEEIEEEIRRLREPLESTLMDVRELVSNLENPFNYATRVLSLDAGKDDDEAGVKGIEPIASEERAPANAHSIFPELRAPGRHNLSVLLCSYLLLKVLGRERALSFLNSRFARKIAPISLLEALNDSVELLSSYESVNELVSGQIFKEDLMLLAAYLVHALAANADERFFTSLCLMLKLLENNPKPIGR